MAAHMRTRHRRTLLFGAPLALGVLEVFHPRGRDAYEVIAADVTRWLAVHLVQLPLFGLVALSVFVLVRGLEGWAATASRIGLAFFVVFYTALDSMAGIAAGVLVRQAQHLPPDQQQVVAARIDVLSANFMAPFAGGGGPAFLVTVLGGLGWVVGLMAAAVALRRSGAPLGAAALVGVAAVFAVHDAVTAPFAMLCLLAGAVYVEFLSPARQPV